MPALLLLYYIDLLTALWHLDALCYEGCEGHGSANGLPQPRMELAERSHEHTYLGWYCFFLRERERDRHPLLGPLVHLPPLARSSDPPAPRLHQPAPHARGPARPVHRGQQPQRAPALRHGRLVAVQQGSGRGAAAGWAGGGPGCHLGQHWAVLHATGPGSPEGR